MKRSDPSVALISLPWTTLTEPSLGLSILRSVLDDAGISCRVRHSHLFALEFLQALSYYALANVFALNDFLFSAPIDRQVTSRQMRWLTFKTQELLSFGLLDEERYGGADGVAGELLNLRHEVIPRWLEREADRVAQSDATLVGCTCMFDQTIGSVAFARLVKERAPDKLVVLGGYAVRPPTAGTILEAFDWIDAICVGEGEESIVGLAEASVGRVALADVDGLAVRRGDGSAALTKTPRPIDMNTSPVPNFDDFYADLAELSQQQQVTVEVERLPLENSRGCWWGAKKHCVFCGIHDDDLVYRSKDAETVIATMDKLHQRHGVASFRFSDYILPFTYYSTLLPVLAERGAPYRITSEMKSNVNPERFRLLADAGFAEVQPGVESFLSPVLRAMDKGVSATQNVQTLLLGRKHGIRVHYNLLYGLPDDDEVDYERMLAALPRLFHLDAPSTRLEVQITRYAPLHVDPTRFGIEAASYEPSYEIIFSEDFLKRSGFELNDFCYYFERPFENTPRLNEIYLEIDALVDRWKRIDRDEQRVLTYELNGEDLHVIDSRSGVVEEHVVTGIDAEVLHACERATSQSAVARQLGIELEGGLDAALERLDDAGLIFREGDELISLVLPAFEVADSSSQLAEAAA